jgi:cell pole-organizing protein PopZ
MAQPNVAREPSMDEILASIRRIIESNDPVPSGIATGMAEPEGFSGSAANDDMEEVPLTIDDTFAPRRDDFRAPLQGFHAEPPQPQPAPMAREPEAPAQQPQRSLSLADVAARVRAASERNPGLRELAPKAPEDHVAQASSPLMTGRMAAAGGSAQIETPQHVDWNEPAPHAEGPAHMAVPSFAPAPEPEIVTRQPIASEPAPSALISTNAGQQVARSFQDLAVAIDEAERRSYDDIAADLLRPMLQEWLDENLPTLVERLVREEIERVARGNRR